MSHSAKRAHAKAKPEERSSLCVGIPKTLDRALELKAAELDRPKRQLVEEAIAGYLDSLRELGNLPEGAA